MMLVLSACPALVLHAKTHYLRTAKYIVPITMIENKNCVEESIKKVLKMIPLSISAIMPYNHVDPWWTVRNIINPVIIIFAPHFVLSTSVDIVLSYVKNYDTLITVIFVNLYFFILAVLYEFIGRYIKWSIEESKIANALHIMKEEQKLD